VIYRLPATIAVAVISIALLPPSAAAPPAINYHKDLPAALKEAKSLRVPAFVVLVKPKATAPDIVDARLADKSRAFACANVPLTPALAKQYDLDGEFHILLLDADGAVVEKYGADVSAEKLWFRMNGLDLSARADARAVLKSDADAKGKKAALATLVRLGAAPPDLIPLFTGPAELKDAARKALTALPGDAVATALLDALKSEDAAVRTAVHPLAVQATGYKASPLKVWQSGTAEDRAAAWDKWNAAVQARFYPLNAAVLAFCEKHMGEQVNNGECAMLVVEAFKGCNAKPIVHSGKTYIWGRALQPGEPVVPGDVVQYEGAQFAKGRTVQHHTAVIHKALGPDQYELLEQNVNGVKKVQTGGKLDLGKLQEGSVIIYRPLPK
jgi:hypothetical protein